MIENSVAGLEMLAGEVYVTVNHEKHHQYALERYRVAPGARRHVAVELGWCVIREGRHSGENAIEVRLDGRRIGELTFLMSQRYAPVVKRLVESGGRPGCAAVVQRTTRGLAVMLRLPRSVEEVPTLVGAAPPVRRPARRLRLGWLAAGVAGVAAVAAILAVVFAPDTAETAGGTRAAGPVPVGPGAAGEPAPASSATPRASATTAPTSSTTPLPTTSDAAEPAPPRTSRPAPAAACDPNYRGACVPVARDVDCAGTGNGPAFVTGPVQVVGEDVYRLDPNKDGVGCE
jgi:hypothetical protein